MLRIARSGQIQQILATVLAIITAIGGLGIAGSSNNGGGSAISVPGVTDEGTTAPTGKGVPLAEVEDYGNAIKGKVVVGGKTYDNAWKFDGYDRHRFVLNGNYNTLTATIVFLDEASRAEASFEIGNKNYTLNKENPRRNISLNVRNVTELKAYSRGQFALVNARLY